MKISRMLTMVGVVFALIVLASVVLEAAEQARGPLSPGNAVQEYDFGDAPDPSYPTLIASNGARHALDQEHFLGTLVDSEPDGQPDAPALGDDNSNQPDEDGVLFTSPLLVGEMAQVEVVASLEGLLNAWLDFNSDGDWADEGEQIFTDMQLLPGPNPLIFPVPSGSVPGPTFSRWRFSDQGGLGYSTPPGTAPPVGEVEDHLVELLALFGWLEGFVMDREVGDTTTCTPASVQIDPGAIVVGADPSTGYYGPVELAAALYSVQASAHGYSTETVSAVDVVGGATTTQYLYLERPVISVQPGDLISVTAVISQPTAYPLTITNEGHQDLEFEIEEGPTGEDLPWVSEDPISGTLPPAGGVDVDVTFHCTEPGDHVGELVIVHNDPCEDPVIVPIVLHCQAPTVWDKWVDDQPWVRDMIVPAQFSDTLKVVDVFAATEAFALEETWNPDHLALRDWIVEPPGTGVVLTTTGHLLWEVPPGPPEVVTITKWFHVEPSTWLDTILQEELWVGQEVVERRPVSIQKLPPQLWIDATWEPQVFAGEPVTFTLLYGNLGGRENDVTIRNIFPPEAPFRAADPPPADSGPSFALWTLGTLEPDQSGAIVVTATLDPSLPPSTTVVITDVIVNHAGEVMDIVEILFHVEEPPPPVWDKWVNGQPWVPDPPVTVQVSDTLEIVDVFTARGLFALEETWNPDHLALLDWIVEPPGTGVVLTNTGYLLWEVPPGLPEVVTITKKFHVEPCTWPDTILEEELWVGQEIVERRPVSIVKEAPQLWIDAQHDPEALAGAPVTFTLLYGNLGGRENRVVVWNTFPAEAPFLDSEPPPADSGAAGDFAMWIFDGLDKGQSGSIVVTATLDPSLPPSTTVVITDVIYDHVFREWDRVLIDFHVGGSAGPGLFDLGDAPDSTNHAGVAMSAYPAPVPATVTGQFPSVFDPATGLPPGPLHREPRNDAWLGLRVSREFDADLMPDGDGWPNLDPPSDRANRDGFDDGLHLPLHLPDCEPTVLTYTVTVTPGASNTPRYVNVWFDWQRNGDWADVLTCGEPGDAPEWAVQNQILTLGPGIHVQQTPVFLPYNKAPDQPVWMRVSIAEQRAPSPEDGRGPPNGYRYGETEDYLLPGEGGPTVDWKKLIGGVSWHPGITFTVETSDTVVVQDVITAPDPGTPFVLAETWNPDQLALRDFGVSPPGAGQVISGDGFLDWEVPSDHPEVITLTKWFHVEPSTWRQTTLIEILNSPYVDEPSRSVEFFKIPPDLRLDALYEPDVYAGDVATFTLVYSNAGGNENDVVIYNEFPPAALLVDAKPSPSGQAPDGSAAKWEIGDLTTDQGGQIEVTVAIEPGLNPSTTVVITDYIYNHAGEESDQVLIEFHIDESPPQPDDHDLYMKDNPLDDGSVPSSAPWWLSPDMWVRNDGDCTNPHHQNPVAGINSTICVRVRNRMTSAIHNVTVNVYWGSAALGFHWPGGWSIAGSAHIMSLGPGAEAVRAVPWSTPNIAGHFCLLARADSPDDPVGSGWDTMVPAHHVPNNNNIAMRNLNIVEYPEITECGFTTALSDTDVLYLDVVNTTAQSVMVDVRFDSPDFPLNSGQILVEPGGLWDRWTTLAGFDPIYPSLTLTGFPAAMRGITMDPYETVPMTVTITAEIDERFTLYVSEQRANGEWVGGVVYLRQLPHCISLPVILRRHTPSTRAVEGLAAPSVARGGHWKR